MEYDVEIALRANTFSKEGKVFDRWTTDPNRSMTYTDKQVVKNLSMGDDVSLFAIWVDANVP
jgi:hypothetical protein